MARQIFRINLDGEEGWREVTLRRGAELLFIGSQTDQLRLWVEMDETKPPTRTEIWVGHDGSEVPDVKLLYLGSAISTSGQLVWHVYARE